MPKGALARGKRAVRKNWTLIMAMAENPNPIEISHHNPEPGGTSPKARISSGVKTSNR